MVERGSRLTELTAPDLDTVKRVLALKSLNSVTTLTMNPLSRVSSGLEITDKSQLNNLDLKELEEVDG